MSSKQISISFLGGPFDGHRQTVMFDASQLAERVALPVSRSIFRMFEGVEDPPPTPITSIAIYDLYNDSRPGENTRQYCYCGSMAPPSNAVSP